MPRYKVAVIGCAGRGRMHIDAYEHIDDAEVVACCAPSPTRRDPLAADYRLRAYGDVGEMLAAEQPDLVHITTGPGPRGQLMKQVAEHEIPLCTVEKPLAVGVRDWRSIEELEAVGGTRFAVCHQLRWQTNLASCREALESGRLGAVRFLEFSAGMNLPAQGTHTLHYGGSLNGDAAVVSVFGAASGLTEGDPLHPGPEHTVAQLVFENGVRAMYQCNKNTYGSSTLHLSGPKGEIVFTLNAGYGTLTREDNDGAEVIQVIKPIGLVSSYQSMGYVAAYEELIDLAEAGGKGRSVGSGQDARRVVQIMTGMLKSQQAGNTLVEVPQ